MITRKHVYIELEPTFYNYWFVTWIVVLVVAVLD